MTDYSELKALAEAATPGPWEATNWQGHHPACGFYDQWYVDTNKHCDYAEDDPGQYIPNHNDKDRAERDIKFIAAANPAAVLELIAEVERFRSLFNQANKAIDRVHAMYKKAWLEKLGQAYPNYGGFPDKLEQALAERDQLKTENEALRKDAERYRWLTRNWFTMTTSYSGGVKFHTGGERWSALADGSVDEAIDAAMTK